MRLIDADELLKKLPREELVSRIIVSGMPTIDPVLRDKENGITYAPVPRGRWKVWHHGVIGCSYSCTECGTSSSWPAKYCPNCGARMEEQEGD